jgi:hypothetical protein
LFLMTAENEVHLTTTHPEGLEDKMEDRFKRVLKGKTLGDAQPIRKDLKGKILGERFNDMRYESRSRRFGRSHALQVARGCSTSIFFSRTLKQRRQNGIDVPVHKYYCSPCLLRFSF